MFFASAPPRQREPRLTALPTLPATAETPSPLLVTFEGLYDEYYPFVARTVRRLGVTDDAVEDVCQEAFVVIYRRLHEFEGRAKLKTWVYRIVANVVLNQNRTQRRKAPHQRNGAHVDPEELATTNLGPEAALRQNQAAALARVILMNMSEAKRMAFVLVELEGMSYAEAAASLDQTFDAVRARVRAARAEFEQQVRLMDSLPGEVNHV
jgi:RNA polymerase sigma-70 factor, ECF subfamily